MELLLSPLPLSISYQRILLIAIKIVNYYKILIGYQNDVKISDNSESFVGGDIHNAPNTSDRLHPQAKQMKRLL